ncbi:MAG: hypothetical protein CVV24_09395 [Ignavibacteriae bacterium HGW-Ignavibacteriae-3]|nr:MAG: hypothetical protein CVV24_09395 [Ignavibacteriae bacterium HGW-Ignavibacteriae-3]
MAEIKTKATSGSATAFLNKIKDPGTKKDCFNILEMMEAASKSKPVMWGSSIIGFGNYHYVYASGREGDWFNIGFSPRKQNITLYLMGGLENLKDELEKFGKHKTGKGCIYIKSLDDIRIPVLKKMLIKSVKRGKR